MNRTKNLLYNVIIFAIGTLGSKLLQFLLIPYYTDVLSTAEYGTVDLLQNVGLVLIPVFSLTIFDAVFRYAMDKNYDKKAVFTSGMAVVTGGAVLLIAFSAILDAANIYSEYIWLIAWYTISNMMRSVVSQFTRAIDKVKLYTIDNFLQTLSILILNILFLTVFNFGIQGYMMGYIFGNVLSFVFLVSFGKLWSYISTKDISGSLFKTLILFSIPLIPNTICWWISNSTNRFMITYYIDESATGIFSVAYKIPSMLSILSTILFQAWQMSANKESENKDIDHFYGKMAEYLQCVTFLGASVIVILSKFIIGIMANDAYYEAWQYVPILVLSVVFFTLAQLLGSLYTTFKKTLMAFVTNLITAIINIALNMILIPKIGIQGACITTAISYLVLWISRIFDTRRLLKIKYNVIRTVLNCVLLTVQSIIVVLEVQMWYIYATAIILLLLIVNFHTVWELLTKVLFMLGDIKKKVVRK